jgi:hypothetical protein
MNSCFLIAFNFSVFTLVLYLCFATASEMILAHYMTSVVWRSV